MHFDISLYRINNKVGKAAVFFNSYLLEKFFKVGVDSKCHHYFFHMIFIANFLKDVNVLDILDIMYIQYGYKWHTLIDPKAEFK